MRNIMKTCTKCKEEKPEDAFYPHYNNKRKKTYLTSSCKSCISGYAGSYYQKNAEAIKESASKHYKENKAEVLATQKKWADRNKDKVSAAKKKWKQLNPEKRASDVADYRAKKDSRSPAWANREAIDFVYFAATAIHKIYGGMKPHVDHIIPMRGENVCGLHVENNLQLLSAKDNTAKGNTFSW